MLSLSVVSKLKIYYFSLRNLELINSEKSRVYKWCIFKVAQCILFIAMKTDSKLTLHHMEKMHLIL